MSNLPSGEMMDRLTKSGYEIVTIGSVFSSGGSRSSRLTSETVRSLLASTATGDVYAPSHVGIEGVGNHSVMQFTRSLAILQLLATKLLSVARDLEMRESKEPSRSGERSSPRGRRASGSRSSEKLLPLSLWVSRRIATKSPFSLPQHSHPFSATRHRGAKVRSLIVSHSCVIVFSR